MGGHFDCMQCGNMFSTLEHRWIDGRLATFEEEQELRKKVKCPRCGGDQLLESM